MHIIVIQLFKLLPKKDSIPVFSHFVKTTKTESETLYTIFCRQNRDLPVFRSLEGTEFAQWAEYALDLRQKALDGEITLEEYTELIRK